MTAQAKQIDPPDVATILTRVVLQSEETIRGRGYVRLDVIEPLHELSLQVEREVKMPREGDRAIFGYTQVLVRALREVEAARDVRDGEGECVWLQVVGLLLPIVRRDAGRALEARRTIPRG